MAGDTSVEVASNAALFIIGGASVLLPLTGVSAIELPLLLPAV